MSFINFLRRKLSPRPGTGALDDPRSPEEKEKDFKFEEIVTTADPVNWVEKPQSEWRKFPISAQDGSGSCVAQTLSKQLGIIYFLKNGDFVSFSATHIYQRRLNKPATGMAGVDAFTIAQQGVTLEQLVPSQNMNDTQMDSVKVEEYKQEVGRVFKIGNYVILPEKNIDVVASTIQKTKKGVMIWIYATSAEWDRENPTIIDPNLTPALATVRHSITAVDFILYNGEKALIIEDSWGKQYGLNGQRVVTSSFFSARNYFVAYPIDFKFAEGTTPKPTHNFPVDLSYIYSVTNLDIKALQDILKYEGLFPVNTESTGFYGAITAKGVLAFQRKYRVADEAELTQYQGKLVGTKTRAKLNELYG